MQHLLAQITTPVVQSSGVPTWLTLAAVIASPVMAVTAFLGFRRSMRIEQKAVEKEREQERTHYTNLTNAMWGFGEGATRIPGIYEAVMGDGNGNAGLVQISKETSAAVKTLTTEVRTNAKDVRQHMDDDAKKFAALFEGRKPT